MHRWLLYAIRRAAQSNRFVLTTLYRQSHRRNSAKMPAVAQWLIVEPPPNSPGPPTRPNTKDLDAHGADKRAKIGAGFARLALVLGLICGAVALLAGPGYRAELLSLCAGLQAIRWAAIGALAGAVMALLALGLVWPVSVRRSISFAAAARTQRPRCWPAALHVLASAKPPTHSRHQHGYRRPTAFCGRRAGSQGCAQPSRLSARDRGSTETRLPRHRASEAGRSADPKL